MHPTSEGNHLLLFLNMKQRNDLPKDSGNLVEFTISIKDLENGKDKKSTGAHLSRSLLDEQKYYKHIFLTYFTGNCRPVPFLKQCSSWGLRKFISLEDFKDKSKGYLIKGKCCVEAKVASVGPSKTE